MPKIKEDHNKFDHFFELGLIEVEQDTLNIPEVEYDVDFTMKSENLNKGQNEFADKVMKGLEISFQKLLEFKKQKNSPLVIMRDGKIVKIMAEDFYKDSVRKDNLTYLSHEVMNLKEIPFAKLLAISDSTSGFLFELSDDEKYTNH